MDKTGILISWVSVVTVAIASTATVLLVATYSVESIGNSAIVVSTLATLGLVIWAVQRTTDRHPKALSLALVGPPGVGKTVYLTMLYRELESKQVRGLSFAPYGRKTIEEVGKTFGLLRKGMFPPPTSPDARFVYEARATYRVNFIPRRFRIQINDFAGELLDEFNITSDSWLHRTEYFDYVVSADELIFMLDCERLHPKNKNNVYISDIESVFVATLHTFIEKRSNDPTKLLDVPVAILFSKSDVLASEEEQELILEQVPRLLDVCYNRCKYFKTFFVTALGSTPIEDDDGIVPPKELSPEGIVEPLLWFMGV